MKKFGFLLATAFLVSLGWTAVYGHMKEAETNIPSRVVQKEVNGVAQAKDTSMKSEYEKYQKKTEKKINEYKKRMKQLEAKSKNLKNQAIAEAKEGMADLKKKMNVAEEKLKSMKATTGEASEKMKAEVDSAMESVKESYEKVAAHFK